MGKAGAVMTKQTRRMRVAATILFSLIMACLLAFGGLLAGWYLWGYFGPPAKDPDDTAAYFFGLLVGGVMALVGGIALLWKFWPRQAIQMNQNRGIGPNPFVR
jgi:hypothetical protein